MTTELTPEQVAAAVKENVSFPHVVKNEVDDPVYGQGLGLLSMELFDEPRVTKRGKKVYGFAKLRGNYDGNEHDAKLAQDKASDIVRLQDSKHKILIVPVGKWFPITEDDDASREKLDVKMNKDDKDDKSEIHLRDEAAREKAKAERAKIRELTEKAEELRREKDEDRDIEGDQTSLDFYTKKRFTEDQVYQWYRSKEVELEEWRQKLETVRKELYNLRQQNPSHEERWVDRMNEVRRERKIPDYVPNELHENDLGAWFERQSSQ